jgi:hypothetical protein
MPIRARISCSRAVTIVSSGKGLVLEEPSSYHRSAVGALYCFRPGLSGDLPLRTDYEPAVGRWTAKDHLGSEASSPYTYAAGDPIGLIDADGLAPKPASTPEAPGQRTSIPDLFRMSACTGEQVGGSIHGVYGLIEKLSYFSNLVKTGGPLDIKGRPHTQGLDPAARSTAGNVNYGILGKALGLPDLVLLYGAGVADIFDTIRDGRWRDFLNRSPYGDDLPDSQAILRGIEAYNVLYGPNGARPCRCKNE